MPRRDLNIYTKESLKECKNEPEEGEIVDDCELIVSSDEELCMRQRIRELEAENEEIEQIAVISRCYVDEFKPLRNNLGENRAARVPTDASSISSTEFVTPKKRKRRKSKERKRKHCHHHHHHHHRHDLQQQPQYSTITTHSHTRKTQCKRRQKIIAKKRNKLHSDRYMYKEISNETAYLYSPDSSVSSSSSLTDTETYSKNSLHLNRKDDFNYGSIITRDTLRLAVSRSSGDARFSTKKSCLKDKLLRQELVSHVSTKEFVEEDTDDVIEVIEPEADIHTVDEDSSDDSMEEKELRLIALKSAVMKKHMARKRRNAEVAYSPTDFDGENKLDYIDVVDLEENDLQNGCVIVSPEASPQLMMLEDQDDSQLMMDCKPVDMDIANSDSEDATMENWSKAITKSIPTFSYASKEFAKQFQYNMYVHDIQLPPPPPGVDDYEELPPPPPRFITYNSQMEDMELENEEFNKDIAISHIKEESMLLEDIKPYIKPEINDLEEEEEEEEALRALLLSKFQSPKNQKKLEQEPNLSYYKTQSNGIKVSDTFNKKPIESILKEAVKRLKVHTQMDSFNKESCSAYEDTKENNSQSQSHEGWDEQNDNDSMISLSALRKRLIELRNKNTQLTEKDQIQMVEDDTQKVCSIRKQESLEVENENTENTSKIHGEHPIRFDTNSSMPTNKVDVSDITRRLQQIKEKILNSNSKQNLQENSIVTNDQVNDLDYTLRNTTSTVSNIQKENDIEADINNSILTTNTQSMGHTDIDTNMLTKHKIDKEDIDATKKHTTFKVTISNSAVLKAGDSLHKENANENLRAVENISTYKTIKASYELCKTSIENSQEGMKKDMGYDKTNQIIPEKTSKSETQPVLPVTTLPTYSVIRTTKIVKPNKIINTNMDLKRRLATQPTDAIVSMKSSKTEPFTQVPISNDKNRLITSFEQVKHMCKIPQFIISVQNSSNESSEDEWGDAYDTIFKPLYEYNDNASPLSLNLESPCLTPTRSNSPVDTTNNHEETGFEDKLDKFLKTVRTTVVRTENINEKTAQSESCKTNKTPVAVRHLPAAAQSEYRRLIHRMKLLQNQRKSTELTENSTKSTIDTNAKNPHSEVIDKNETDTSIVNNSSLKTSLVKQVLIRNASNNNNTNTTEPQTNDKIDSHPPKFHKTNVLRSYENIYVKIGAGIVKHLDKSLKLVEEAKKAKITKLKLENRLKELKAEMDILQGKHKEEQQKISHIYPNICSTNDVISSLKQKRTKVFKAALSLGKTLKGEEYRLNNDLKESITTKTKKLATTIKLVNSLKAQDIANIEDVRNINTNKEVIRQENNEIQLNNTLAPVEANLMKTQLKQNEVKEDETNSFKENTITVEDKIANDEEDTTITATQLGGNTEFQKEEHDNLPKELATAEMTDCAVNEDGAQKHLCSYISPLEHLRNMDSNMDPNGVVCPYDLMGNCEDATCKYVHISPNIKTKLNII